MCVCVCVCVCVTSDPQGLLLDTLHCNDSDSHVRCIHPRPGRRVKWDGGGRDGGGRRVEEGRIARACCEEERDEHSHSPAVKHSRAV